MHSPTADRIFANEADPAFRRRARWIEHSLRSHSNKAAPKLIDIGCGRGFYFPLYEEIGARFVGVEQDPVPLGIARQRAATTDSEVLDCSADALPLASETFDVVVMSEILEHLDEPVAALREAHRMLVGGGQLLVTVPHARYPFAWDPINWVLDRTTKRPIRRGPLAGIWANHVRLYTDDDVAAEIRAAGFVVDEIVFQTHHCMPFVHNIVYGLGRPLLERGIVRGGWARAAERSMGEEASSSRFNPVALGIGLIHWFDRANADCEARDRPSLNICVRARKLA